MRKIFIQRIVQKLFYFSRVAIVCPPKTHYVHNFPEKLRGMFEMHVKGMETIVPTVIISQKVFNSLADCEKLPYLQQKIEEKLK